MPTSPQAAATAFPPPPPHLQPCLLQPALHLPFQRPDLVKYVHHILGEKGGREGGRGLHIVSRQLGQACVGRTWVLVMVV